MTRQLDASHLESLLGYNARRATLYIIDEFMQAMKTYDLRPAEFSVLSLILHNPGITSRQLCASLDILPPNLVVILKQFEKRELVTRTPHPTDGRAFGLSLTPKGSQLVEEAEAMSALSDLKATSNLVESERKTLIALLQKIYAQK
jgi:DNA-binding MarR family transcriptional regulator